MIEQIEPAHRAALAAVAALMREYQVSLGVPLFMQQIEAELAALPGAYAAPSGALFGARDAAGTWIGCVAVRAGPAAQSGQRIAELKRLYVLPSARGNGAARGLVDAALAFARGAGYTQIVLDTLPDMHGAQTLYTRYGFVDIPPYTTTTIPGTRFMGLRL